jgi:predicted ribosomally synthesized peptide with nif11-like leader
MSAENYSKFVEAVAGDPELAAKVQAIHAATAREVAERLAALSAEAGTPISADEFLATASSQAEELSDDQLEAVAGGVWKANAGNIFTSVFSFGVMCAIVATTSAIVRTADDCQISRDTGLNELPGTK